MKVLTVKEVKEAEARAAEYGLNEDMLIENAAAALKDEILRRTSPRDKICVLCGGGNNGADGLSLARMLTLCGRKTTVVLTSERLGSAAKARLAACEKLGVRKADARDFCPDDYDFAVDAMLGTGCNRPLEGIVREITQKLNDSKAFTLSVDIPTGLDADTGETDCAVEADATFTFSFAKIGHLIGAGRNYIGELKWADIGLESDSKVNLITPADVKIPTRKALSHKYNYGRVRVIAGSPEMIGASLLAHESALAALRSGAGLCTLCVPESLRAAYQARVKEETLCFLPDRDGKIIFHPAALDKLFEKTDAILVGPGMGENGELKSVIGYIAEKFDGTLVIDADGLNAIAADMGVLDGRRAKIILTPHVGEFERIAREIDRDLPFIERVRSLAEKYDLTVAAKSATTVISDGRETWLNISGTPALAKGGSGDVLGGMISAFACRFSPVEAAKRGCYYFGKLAERAVESGGDGEESLLASDLYGGAFGHI